jgi:hypothetical protein
MASPVLPEVRKCTSVFALTTKAEDGVEVVHHAIALGRVVPASLGLPCGDGKHPLRLAVAAAPRIPALEAGGRADVELVGDHRLRRPQGQQVLEGRVCSQPKRVQGGEGVGKVALPAHLDKGAGRDRGDVVIAPGWDPGSAA